MSRSITAVWSKHAVDPNANIIFGSIIDETMNGEVAITVIATGFPNEVGVDSYVESVPVKVAAEPTGRRVRREVVEDNANDDVPDFLSKIRKRG